MSEQKLLLGESGSRAQKPGSSTAVDELFVVGDGIDEELDRLDRIINEALGDDISLESARAFVDGFKQVGGE